jgi:hypothetical protein
MNFTMPHPHTPEPWEVDDLMIFATEDGIMHRVADCQSVDDELTFKTEEANAARIVRCVNAMAGIARPEDIHQDIQDMINWLHDGTDQESRDMAETWWAKYPKRNG